MLTTNRLQRITVHYDPDGLLSSRRDDEGLDCEGTVCDYAVSLSLYLADIFDAVSVEVTPVPGSGATAIHVEPDPTAQSGASEIHDEIMDVIAEHYELGDFWVVPA